jgi:hypothetical protein
MTSRVFSNCLIFCILFILTQHAVAKEIEGVEIAEVLPADGERPELFLNGAAKRKFLMFVDVYVGSLYVEEPSNDPGHLINQDTNRRMEFNMLRNVRGRKIADAFYEGMRLNVSQEKAEAMEDNINRLLDMFDQQLQPGDKAVVEYRPGEGTHVVLAGQDRGTIPSKELFDAILSIWIGEYPVSADFKSAILGIEESLAEAPSKHYSNKLHRD